MPGGLQRIEQALHVDDVGVARLEALESNRQRFAQERLGLPRAALVCEHASEAGERLRDERVRVVALLAWFHR